MGKLSRTKGHQFERDTANLFKEIFPNARRAVEDSVVNEGVDIANTGPFRVQCKRYKGSVPMSKIEEVDTTNGGIAVLVSRSDRERAKATLYLDDFLKLIKRQDWLDL